MNIGPSDIFTGIRLAYKIYQYGFCEQNGASMHYRMFVNDISNFYQLLVGLENALESAQQRYERRGSVLASQAYEPLAEGIENERKHIIGNFLGTLQECEALVERDKQYRVQSSNPRQNLVFVLGQHEQQFEQLRNRLRFHTEKIHLVLDRLTVDLLTDLDAKVDDILAISEQTLQISQGIQADLRRLQISSTGHIVGDSLQLAPANEDEVHLSDAIASKFGDSLKVNAPTSIEAGVPLIEGFDALLSHYQRFTQILDPTDEKLLVFLKLQWMIDRLKESTEYKKARPGYYYKRAIHQIERAIVERGRTPGVLMLHDEATLLGLDESCFQIWTMWTPAVEEARVDPLQPGPQEELIASMELASAGSRGPDKITVFRSFGESFRVVTLSTSEQSSTVVNQMTREIMIHIQEHKLVPRYALPTLQNPCLELVVIDHHLERVFSFASIEDLHKFQTALMGYEVSHDQSGIRCQFSKNVSSLNCSARIQLWQDPVGQQPSAATGSMSPLSSDSINSFSRTSGTRRDSVAPSLMGTSTIAATQNGWEGRSIKLPVLTIITQLKSADSKKRFAIMTIELSPGVQLSAKDCKCHYDYETCQVLVLTATKTKNKKLTVRIAYSDSDDSGLPVATTFDIFPMRTPRHQKQLSCEIKQTELLLLKFDSVEEKKQFHDELDCRFQVRDMQIMNQQKFKNDVLYLADHPQRHQQTMISPARKLSMASQEMSRASTLVEPRSPTSTIGKGKAKETLSHTSSVRTVTAPPEAPLATSPPTPPASASSSRTPMPLPAPSMSRHNTPELALLTARHSTPLQPDLPISSSKKSKSRWAFLRSL